jgi:hypothetical protein
MSQSKLNQVNDTKIEDSSWRNVSRIGGVAAFISVVCALITMTVIITIGGEPSTATEYFALLNNDRIVGLLRMDFASVINLSSYYLMFFGIYTVLRRENRAYATLATALAFVGITLWFANHSAFSMISLSDQYAAARTDVERSQLLAAGKAIISSDMWHSTGAIMGGIFLESAAVLISFVMLRSKVFGKVIAWIGILTHGLDLAHIVIGIFSPKVGVILMAVAGPLILVWLPLIGLKLIKLGRYEKMEKVKV